MATVTVGPVVWDRLHAYHNPLTGSYHTPPGSRLLSCEEDERAPLHISQPEMLYRGSAEGSSPNKQGWQPAVVENGRGPVSGRPDSRSSSVPLFCRFCCPGLFNGTQTDDADDF
mmetsp:Transcript_64372/g.119675  ORF Transcript_64372/g.119675 Transcript_64372/m.119675 type:complete len:114 (-) Transcript_64372:87-428(-)